MLIKKYRYWYIKTSDSPLFDNNIKNNVFYKLLLIIEFFLMWTAAYKYWDMRPLLFELFQICFSLYFFEYSSCTKPNGVIWEDSSS